MAPGTGAVDVFHIGPVNTSGSFTTNQESTDTDADPATQNDTQSSGDSVILGLQQITSVIVNGGNPIREGIEAILHFVEGTLQLLSKHKLARFH